MKFLIVIILLAFSFDSPAQMIKTGQWRGSIIYDSLQIPFTFEVGYPNGDVPEITIINGSDRRVISNATVDGDSIFIPMEPFDVEIRAKFTAMSMSGLYKKYYRGLIIPFKAEFGKPRMKKNSVRPNAPIQERWAITLSPDTPGMSQGIGLFKQRGHIISGTIMTQVSDYRFFEGILDGDSIKLSCFDGAHAFAFLGRQIDNGWSGEMVYGSGYSEPWEAVYDDEAELRGPFEMVEIEQGKHKPYYDLLGAGEGKDAIDPAQYAGKVLVIQLFGTWCPNSHDQTKYLVDWYEENKHRGVSILASSYEANYTRAYGMERLEKYKQVNNIPYDLVLGGRLSKTAAAMPFPFMQRIEAFPTLVILDKQGYVRHVHSYFNGPATGDYYRSFDRRFNEIIDALVAE
ncbi:TlpA disulfide reductase family protein [Ekhidna sp.]|uniref:TlpA family protein disulfide reductase n=1 Tax=Ekhidna sp. TaxID=2608089 RepID=UPI00329699FD